MPVDDKYVSVGLNHTAFRGLPEARCSAQLSTFKFAFIKMLIPHKGNDRVCVCCAAVMLHAAGNTSSAREQCTKKKERAVSV